VANNKISKFRREWKYEIFGEIDKQKTSKSIFFEESNLTMFYFIWIVQCVLVCNSNAGHSIDKVPSTT
jgi:hypothetical protein